VDVKADKSSVVKNYVKITTLPDKEGPCIQVAKSTASSDKVGSATATTPTQIVAFEFTFRLRPAPIQENGNGAHVNVNDSHISEDDTLTADKDEEEDPTHNESRSFPSKDH